MIQFVSILILIAVAVVDIFIFNLPKVQRYKHWHRPWMILITMLILLIFSSLLTTFLAGIIPWDIVFLEIIFSSVLGVIWLIIKFVFIITKFDEAMLKFLKKINQSSAEKKSVNNLSYLLWPYYNVKSDEILTRAGTGFFRWLFLVMATVIPVVYLIVLIWGEDIGYTVASGYAIIGTLVFCEWYIYFTSGLPIEEPTETPPVAETTFISDYEKIWRKYIETFPETFNSAFILLNDKSGNKSDDNDKSIVELMKHFTNDGCDIISSDLNLVSSFYKLSAAFTDALNKGGNILILVEIPIHFKIRRSDIGISLSGVDSNGNIELSELFSEYLSYVVHKELPASKEIIKINYFNASKNADAEKKRILLTSVNNMLNDNLLKSIWIKNLELLVVINFHDSCLSTLSQDREFSLILNHINPDYQTLLLTPYRNEIHAGLEYTWMLDKIEERRFHEEVKADKSFFVGFNFEGWRKNWNVIADPLASHPVCSGLELAVIPLTEKVNHIHLLETAYTEFLEGKEDIAVHTDQIYTTLFPVTKEKIHRNILVNVLPVPVTISQGCSDKPIQHFSLVFDSEYNAPRLYKKYSYLGESENFTVILSKPHLFREYFSSNFIYFYKNPVEAIQPQLSKSRINLSLQLFFLLRANKVNRLYIIELLNQFGITDYNSVQSVIFELFQNYLNYNIKDNFSLKYSFDFSFENAKYIKNELFSIPDLNLYQPDFDFLKTVHINDNAGNTLFEISLSHLFQNYLPGQTVSFNGRPFLVDDYNQSTLTMQVRKTESSNSIFYKPLLNFQFGSDFNKADEPLSLSFFRKGEEYRLQFAIIERKAVIHTSCYYEFTSEYNSHVAGCDQPIKKSLNDSVKNKVSRNYNNCRLLNLSWDVTPDFKDKTGLITTMLHVLFYESLPVFFPYHHQYIHILSDNENQKVYRECLPWIFHQFSYSTDDDNPVKDNSAVRLCVVEDSFSDIGVLKAIQRNFTYILKYIFDYLLWIREERNGESEFTLQWKENNYDRLKFLKYGMESDLIDFGELVPFLEVHMPLEKSVLYEIHTKRILSKSDGNVECDFCANPFRLDEVQTLEDGLHRCKSCSNDAIDSEAQALIILEDSKKLYLEHLNIDFNQYKFEFNFITAKKLHEINKLPFIPSRRYDKRKFIGQAWEREIDKVYVEKGYQKDKTLGIIIHELSHIWEYNNLNCSAIRADNTQNIIIEGLAVWTEIFLLKAAGLIDLSDSTHSYYQNDDSEYGKGFRYILANYLADPYIKLKAQFPV